MFHAYFFILLATCAALAARHIHPAQLWDILSAIATVRCRYCITVNPVGSDSHIDSLLSKLVGCINYFC